MAAMPRTINRGESIPAIIEDSKINSLLENPLNGGIPAIDRDAMIAVAAVKGMMPINPPTLFRSRVPVL